MPGPNPHAPPDPKVLMVPAQAKHEPKQHPPVPGPSAHAPPTTLNSCWRLPQGRMNQNDMPRCQVLNLMPRPQPQGPDGASLGKMNLNDLRWCQPLYLHASPRISAYHFASPRITSHLLASSCTSSHLPVTPWYLLLSLPMIRSLLKTNVNLNDRPRCQTRISSHLLVSPRITSKLLVSPRISSHLAALHRISWCPFVQPRILSYDLEPP